MLMKTSVFVALCSAFFFSALVSAEQTPVVQWVARYNGTGNGNDNARGVVVDDSGNVYVTGEIYTNANNYDFMTIKYSPDGNQIWTAQYNGPANGNERTVGSPLVLDRFGNIYITGYSDGGSTNIDYATIKYDPNGNMKWVARYNGPGNTNDRPAQVVVDDSLNVYVTGYSYTTAISSKDFATVKYDPSGNQLWADQYNGPASKDDQATSLAVDADGFVYVTGSSYFVTTDYLTIKYSPIGFRIWTASYDSPAHSADKPVDMAIDSSGNIIVTGHVGVSTTPLNYDYFTVKYSPNADLLWAKQLTFPAGSTDYVHSLAIDASGNVYVTGAASFITQNYLTIKYDSDGNQLWAQSYDSGNSDAANKVVVDKMGNVYVTGDSPYYATVKYDPNGAQLWRATSSPKVEIAWDMVIDDFGNIYVTGQNDDLGTGYDYVTVKYTQHDYCFETLAGDHNSDCKVQFADLAILCNTWQAGFDLSDLEKLADDWLFCNLAIEGECW